jgi:hypothetical protein
MTRITPTAVRTPRLTSSSRVIFVLLLIRLGTTWVSVSKSLNFKSASGLFLPYRPLLILILQLIQLPVNPPQRE